MIRSLGGDYIEDAMNVSGLKRDSITIPPTSRHYCAGISEDLTEFLIRWAIITGVDLGVLTADHRGVYRNSDRELTSFRNNGDQRIADLRVGDNSVEVKTCYSWPWNKTVSELKMKYCSETNVWRSGEKMEERVAVLHVGRRFSNYAQRVLEGSGIKIIGYDELHEMLGEVVRVMDSEFTSEITGITPRINDIRDLIGLHEEISLFPYRLIREQNRGRQRLSKKILRSLNQKAVALSKK